MDESTTTDPTPTDESAGKGNGPTPENAASTEGVTPAKTFDEAYVKQLRKEAADNRKAREAVEAKLREIEDRDKSESEKLAARAAESEARATEAEAKLLRLAVATERKMPATAVDLLHGTTREEIEATADALQAFAKENEQPAPGFDGGARATPEATKKPEDAHRDLLMQVLGRNPAS